MILHGNVSHLNVHFAMFSIVKFAACQNWWEILQPVREALRPSPHSFMLGFRKCWSWVLLLTQAAIPASLEPWRESHWNWLGVALTTFAFRVRQTWMILAMPINSYGTMSVLLSFQASVYSPVKWRQSCLFYSVIATFLYTPLSPSVK